MATKTGKTQKTAPTPPARHSLNTRYRGIPPPPKRKADAVTPEELEERGRKRRKEEDDTSRRRDSVTHLIGSIFTDLEEASDIQKRETGNLLTEKERAAFESSEDIRLNYLRDFRLAAMFSCAKDRKTLQAARLQRGNRFNSIRAARNTLSSAEKAYGNALNTIIGALGWTTVAICLHSENFRTRLLEATDGVDFDARLQLLIEHKQSIEFFARIRYFDWLMETEQQHAQDVLFRDLRCLLSDIDVPDRQELTEEESRNARLNVDGVIFGISHDNTKLEHPHEWELSADGLRATRLTFLPGGENDSLEEVKNIESSETLLERFTWRGRSEWPLQDEPRFRSEFDDVCEVCDGEGDGKGKKWNAGCQCSLRDLKTRRAADGAYFGDRAELRHVHPILGTGVKALQRIPAGSLLAEYVGEIYPVTKELMLGIYNNPTYLYCQTRAKAKGAENALQIDPSIRGNWTRYVNHSCRPKSDFMVYACGEKMLTCLTVRDRAIEFGEEITVSYGRSYFTGQQLACRCGEDICTLWNADKVNNNKITLRQAKQQGVAPEWAL
jgi:SET domain